MHFQLPTTTSLLIALSTLTLTSAAPAPGPQTTVNPGATTPWPVTNFEIGCSPAGCVYSFNISGPATYTGFPAFSTYCTGSDIQYKMVPCADSSVQADLRSTNEFGLVLSVDRYGTQSEGVRGYMFWNATAAPVGEPAYREFVVEAKFYGEIEG